MNGRTTFTDAFTTAIFLTLAVSITTGDTTDSAWWWLARFCLSMAVCYLAWDRYHNRRRLPRQKK